jgi:hypothetical protein
MEVISQDLSKFGVSLIALALVFFALIVFVVELAPSLNLYFLQ